MFWVEGPGASFSLHPGQPLPGEGNSLEQVSAVGRLLYLGQTQPAQEGTYTCECSNVAGNSSQDQLLEVHGEPGWDDLNQVEGARRVGNQAPWEGGLHPLEPKQRQELRQSEQPHMPS